MGNPYVKLLSITKIAQASTEFRTARPHAGKLIAQANFENGTTTSGSPPSLEDIQKDLESILKYLPAMLAVVALFTMAICIAACVGTVCFLKSRKARGENVAVARNIPGRSQLGNSLPFTNETAKDLNGGSTGSLMSSTSTRGNYAPVSLYNAQAGSLPNHAA